MDSIRRCSIEGCGKNTRSGRSPMCEMHYYRVRRNGHAGLKPREDYAEPVRRRRYTKASHTCSVPGCSRVAGSLVESARVCLMHYKRWARTGSMSRDAILKARVADRDALIAEMKRLYLGGMSTTEVGAALKRDASHVSRTLRESGVQMRPRKRVRTNEITYGAAHMRVRSDRGSARRYICTCGAPAAQWSYTHSDPNEMRSREGAYSPDPQYYIALCVPCHKRADLDRLKEAG